MKPNSWWRKSNRSRNWEQEERKEKEEGQNSWASMETWQKNKKLLTRLQSKVTNDKHGEFYKVLTND
jgi:hypothetical protein